VNADQEREVLADAIDQELDELLRFARWRAPLPYDRVASVALLTGLTTTEVAEMVDSINTREKS
jgi:hypothetical protein